MGKIGDAEQKRAGSAAGRYYVERVGTKRGVIRNLEPQCQASWGVCQDRGGKGLVGHQNGKGAVEVLPEHFRGEGIPALPGLRKAGRGDGSAVDYRIGRQCGKEEKEMRHLGPKISRLQPLNLFHVNDGAAEMENIARQMDRERGI